MTITALLSRLIQSPVRKRNSRRSSQRIGWSSAAEYLEDRALLSNINLISTAGNERITLGGGAEVNNFVVSYDGTNYTVTDTTLTPINAIGGLSGFDTDPAAHIVTFNPTSVAFFKRIEINGNGGNDSITINSFRAGAEGLTVIDTGAADGNDTVTIAGDIGNAGSRVTNEEVKVAADNIFLSAGIYTSNKAVLFGGTTTGITLTGSSVIDAGTGSVTLNNTVDGATNLSVTGGVIIFNANIGTGTALTSLSVSGTSVKTQNMTATSAITIEADAYNQLGTISGAGTADLTLRRWTPGVQTFTKNSFPFLAPGFNSVTIGSALTTTLNINSDGDNTIATGSFGFDSELTLIGGVVNIADTLQQGTHKLNLVANTTLAFTGIGGAVGTGDVTISKLIAGGTLTVNGKLGVSTGLTPWGANALMILAPGSTVTFTSGVGSVFTSFAATADTLKFSAASALTAQGDVTLVTTSGTELNGGIFSTTGNISVTGPLSLTGNVLFKIPAGKDLTINGSVTGNGKNILVRGDGGAANSVVFNGSVNGAGSFQIDSSGANTALSVALQNVTATNVLVRGVNISLNGNTEATTANVQLTGAVTLLGHSQLNNTSGSLTKYVRVDGTIDGAYNLGVNAGASQAILTGVIGGGTPLNDLIIVSSGPATIFQNIEVANDFSWTIAELQTNKDNLTLNAGKSVTAGNNITIDVGDLFTNKNGGTIGLNFGNSLTIIQGGNP